MGLLKAFTTATSSVLGDEFKEYITPPDMTNVLVARGIVHHGDGNKNPSEGIITNGSIIMVPESTAMMVIENGKILEFSAEPGGFKFETGSEHTIFSGGFGKGIVESIKKIGSRTTFAGLPPQDQRVYYVNLLALTGNKFGSPQPKKITDDKYGMLEVTFFGEYGIQVSDPAVLVHNIIGSNAKDIVTFQDILEDQFKAKFVEKLTQAITLVMRKEKIPFGDIGMYGTDISNEMNHLLEEDLISKYGIKISDVAIGDINLTKESMERVSKIDDATIFSDSKLQSGLMATASAEALKNASANENGSMMGFMGMNMANTVGASLLDKVNQNPSSVQKEETNEKEPRSLFQTNDSNICPNCKAEIKDSNFCPNCGKKLKD